MTPQERDRGTSDIGGLPKWPADAREVPEAPPPRDPKAEVSSEWQKLGLLVGIVSGLPAVIAINAWKDGNDKPDPLVLGIAALCGAVGTVLFSKWQRNPVWGIGPGLLAGSGVYLATLVYAVGRTQIFRGELLIPAVIGSAPGLGLYIMQVRRANLRGERDLLSVVFRWLTLVALAALGIYLVFASLVLLGVDVARFFGF